MTQPLARSLFSANHRVHFLEADILYRFSPRQSADQKSPSLPYTEVHIRIPPDRVAEFAVGRIDDEMEWASVLSEARDLNTPMTS